MSSPVDASDPVQRWQRLYVDAAGAAPSAAACVAAAFRLADQVWRQVAADPALDARTRTAVTGQQNWARTALSAHQHLIETRAYAHLDVAAPLRCWADPATLRNWLTRPSDLPGFTHLTVADSWGIDEDFRWDGQAIGTRMANLIEQAQLARVFGVPGYAITLRQVTDDDYTPADTDEIGFIEHQVTLATTSGAVFASHPLAADHLADDDLSGLDAALAVLTNTSNVVNELLAAEAQLINDGLTTTAEPTRTQQVRPTRGFTALDLTTPTVGPAAIEAPATRPDPHRRR